MSALHSCLFVGVSSTCVGIALLPVCRRVFDICRYYTFASFGRVADMLPALAMSHRRYADNGYVGFLFMSDLGLAKFMLCHPPVPEFQVDCVVVCVKL